MFHKGFFLFRFLGMVVVIALLVGAGSLLFQAGQTQGYALGLNTAAGKELGAPAPVMPAPYYGHGWVRPHFSPFGPLLGLFFFCGLPVLFFFFMAGGFFRHMAWRRGHWAGGHGHPWGTPPCSGGQQPPAAPPQDPPVPGTTAGESKPG